MLSLLCMTTAMAQEPSICGDWVGVYEDSDMNPTAEFQSVVDWKLYIRIKRIDGQYRVRMKRRIADESLPFSYENNCKVQSANTNEIVWIGYDVDNYDWDSTDKKQGVRIGHTHETVYHKVVLNHGVMDYYKKSVTTYYDTHGHLITTSTIIFPETGSPYCNLYKDDSDW